MMIALMALYLALLFTLVRVGIIRLSAFWKASPLIVLLLLNLGLFIPMGWGAPQGPAIVARNAVAIVPDVAGEVTDVPVVANTPLKAGDVLFRIDPTPYDAQVKAIEAQLKLSTTRLAQMTQLFERDSGRGFDVEQRQSEVDQLKAQLQNAQWNLDKITVRAPADGYVTNVALRKGPVSPTSRCRRRWPSSTRQIPSSESKSTRSMHGTSCLTKRSKSPSSSCRVMSTLARSRASCRRSRPVRPRSPARPWRPRKSRPPPFVVRVKLDDDAFAKALPAGSTGTAAIYTDHVKVSHVIRRVLLRQVAILNYVNPF
jgi:hypothetical protein